MEEWKDIKGYEGKYQVSNLGRVKSLKRLATNNHWIKEKILNESGKKKTRDGYLMVSLAGKTFRVNRLVAETFIPNPLNKLSVNHIDGDKTNNRVDNLEWVTLSENMRHAYKNKLKVSKQGSENPNAKLSKEDVIQIRKEYEWQSKEHGTVALAKKYGVTNATIGHIIRRETYKNV